MIEHLPEVKQICKTYHLLSGALSAKTNTKEYNELKQQMSQDELKNYVPSNFGCTSGNYSGCVCLNKTDTEYLNNHGNNRSESY